MNNKILEIVENSDKDFELVLVSAETLEKFARLIVRECLTQIEQANNSPFVSLDDAKRMKHFTDITTKRVCKHFGVAE